jgi:hypothetical protein
MQAILEHTTTKFKRYFPEIQVSIDQMYINIELNTMGYEDGDYQITIYSDDNRIVAEDIIRIGGYKSTKLQYKVEKKFTQYVK